jgi:hypothetical protein
MQSAEKVLADNGLAITTVHPWWQTHAVTPAVTAYLAAALAAMESRTKTPTSPIACPIVRAAAVAPPSASPSPPQCHRCFYRRRNLFWDPETAPPAGDEGGNPR